jgi:hypothetical protein
MPTIKIIDNVKIDLYSREHPPPHFHVKYAEHEELIEILTFKTYAGYVPKMQRKKVIAWAKDHTDYLLSVFKSLNPGI